ncbi:MAG: hypothetical protein ACRBM6_31485 [Geminicoccales bacterium]
MRTHACVILLVFILSGEAQATGADGGGHPELQVGGPLRIVSPDRGLTGNSLTGSSGIIGAIEPRHGEPSSLSRVLNNDGELLVDLDLIEQTDTDMSFDLNGSVSIAVGYHYVEAEDRQANLEMSGSVDDDHESHRLLFRAHWHFQ